MAWVACAVITTSVGVACAGKTEECLRADAQCGGSNDRACCPGSACMANVVGTGVVTCIALCSTDADCGSGCCHLFDGGDHALCLSQDYCRK